MSFEYFYGGQAESFSFYRIPRQLVTGAEFRHLSTEAKLLYGMMLDRMGLSARNGWFDDFDRVYIYYTMTKSWRTYAAATTKLSGCWRSWTQRASG